MAYIPEPRHVVAAQKYLLAEAAYLRAEVYRATQDYRRARAMTTQELVDQAHEARHKALTELDEARINLYLECGYQPEQVHASVGAALVQGTYEVMKGVK